MFKQSGAEQQKKYFQKDIFHGRIYACIIYDVQKGGSVSTRVNKANFRFKNDIKKKPQKNIVQRSETIREMIQQIQLNIHVSYPRDKE